MISILKIDVNPAQVAVIYPVEEDDRRRTSFSVLFASGAKEKFVFLDKTEAEAARAELVEAVNTVTPDYSEIICGLAEGESLISEITAETPAESTAKEEKKGSRVPKAEKPVETETTE